jgi:ankyrin repeat protein
MALLNSKKVTYTNWLRICIPEDYWEYIFPKGHLADPLYCTSITGLEIPSQLLLEPGADINAVGGQFRAAGRQYRTALQVAALRGYTEVVWLLLRQGADNNARGGDMTLHCRRRHQVATRRSFGCCLSSE